VEVSCACVSVKVENVGLEPTTSALQGRRSPSELIPHNSVGIECGKLTQFSPGVSRQRISSNLSRDAGDGYSKGKKKAAMGLGRIELPTSRLSGVRSHRTELQAQEVGEI
jgi:hypothetical protein